ALAVVLGGTGAALAAAALGLALSPALSGVALAWALVVATAGAAAWAILRARQEAAAPTLGRLIEGAAGGRAGSIVRVVSPTAGKRIGPSAAFWHPMRTWRDAHAPVRLAVDRRTVRRGGSVTATITVPGAERVTLWTRGPGEPWKASLLPLDADGHAVHQVGPIESDLFLRAS